MITYNTKGTLIRTASTDATRQLAEQAGAAYVSHHEDLLGLEVGTCAVVDLDDAAPDQAVEIASRTRGLGIGLTVAARPESDVPFDVRRNISTDLS